MAERGSRGRTPARRTAGRASNRWNWLWRVGVGSAALVALLLGWAALARKLAPAGNTTQERFDTIIVLGTPADADGNPTPTQLARVTEAVHEYERGVAPRMILTGGAAHNQYVEAAVMARTAEAQGIPASAIVVEPKAMDTIQNACFADRIMQAHGWDSAEIISSASHLPRVGMIFSRLPVKWRTHAAPALEPEAGGESMLVEILKTAHYLTWARETERCQP